MKNSAFSTAKWIDNPNFKGMVSEYVKEFDVDKKPLKATLKIVGLGFYSSKINGKLTDKFYYKPLLTDFEVRTGLNNYLYDEVKNGQGRKSIIYDVFDVTKLVTVGKNLLSVLVGTGWYNNVVKDCVDPSYNYGNPKLIFELTLKYKDGDVVVASDNSTLVRSTAHQSNLFGGDKIDFTAKDEEFIATRELVDTKSDIVESTVARDGVLKHLKPKLVSKNGNTAIYDFGINHSGGVKMTVRGKSNANLKITHFEFLNKDGTPNLDSCRWTGYVGPDPVAHIDQVAEYVLSGAEDSIAPLFHWDCYRYVEITCDSDYEILQLESLFIGSLMKKDGDFKCANKTFNRIYKVFLNTLYANLHCGIESDCPHREKLPYTGDGQVTAKAVAYSLDAKDFFNKWLTDIIDAQDSAGFVPYNAPLVGCGGGGCWWSNAITEVPFMLYQTFGDISAIERSYPAIKKALDFYDTMHNGDYIVVKSTAEWLLGDWIAPEMVVSDTTFVNTLAYFWAVKRFIMASKILGYTDQIQSAKALLNKIKNSVNKKFFNKKTLTYSKGIQGEDVMALYVGIVPKKYENALFDKVSKYYQKHGALDTGMVGTPMLIDLLTQRGRADVAFKIMNRKAYPSYAYMMKNESTLAEHWSKHWPSYYTADEGVFVEGGGDVSHCHPVLGGTVHWFTQAVAGLDLSKVYKKVITYAPKLTDKVGWAKAEKQTPFGKAEIAYDGQNGLTVNLTVPKGAKGLIELPRGKYVVRGEKNFSKEFDGTIKLNSGNYTVTCIGG